MTNNSNFTVQILEKIGAPLLSAINIVSGDSEGELESAKIMAQMLGQATQMSTALYNVLAIKETMEQSDSTRLALVALAAPLIAECYIQRRHLPSDDDLKRIEKSLESVISFGENFSPAADHQSRLQTIDHKTVLFDKDQAIMVTMQAMVPVINAVEEFPFGQTPRKLIQDIAKKLEVRAADIAAQVKSSDKLKELIIFKALAELYTSCHRGVTQSAMAGGDGQTEISLDPVWEAFETKASMLEVLIGLEENTKTTSQTAPVAPSPQQPSPAQQAQTNTAPPSGGAGPMGFFKKNPEGEVDAPPIAQVSPTTTVNEQASAQTPQVATTSSSASNPMGFFKPGAKKQEEN